jgi:hypothetical protein
MLRLERRQAKNSNIKKSLLGWLVSTRTTWSGHTRDLELRKVEEDRGQQKEIGVPEARCWTCDYLGIMWRIPASALDLHIWPMHHENTHPNARNSRLETREERLCWFKISFNVTKRDRVVQKSFFFFSKSKFSECSR